MFVLVLDCRCVKFSVYELNVCHVSGTALETLLLASSSGLIFKNPYKVDIIIPILKMRKMKYRGVQSIVHDLTVGSGVGLQAQVIG